MINKKRNKIIKKSKKPIMIKNIENNDFFESSEGDKEEVNNNKSFIN